MISKKQIQISFAILSMIVVTSFLSGYQLSSRFLTHTVYILFLCLIPFFLGSLGINNKAIKFVFQVLFALFIAVNIFLYTLTLVTSELIPDKVFQKKHDYKNYRIYEYRSDLCYLSDEEGYNKDYILYESLPYITFIQKSMFTTSCSESSYNSEQWLERHLNSQ